MSRKKTTGSPQRDQAVDPPITIAQTASLAEWIESHAKRLAWVYITHWHADHPPTWSPGTRTAPATMLRPTSAKPTGTWTTRPGFSRRGPAAPNSSPG